MRRRLQPRRGVEESRRKGTHLFSDLVLPNESFSYDAAGNRTNTGYTTGSDNRLTKDGTYTYSYDAEGNRTARFVDNDLSGTLTAGDTQITESTYDHRNRLTSLTDRAAYGGAASKVVNYVYDLYNRLVNKSLDPDGEGAQPVQNWYYAYDGSEMVLRFNGSAASNLKDRYLWGPAVDQILADEQVSSLGAPGTLYWPLTDNLGSVRMLAHYVSQTDTTTYHNYRIYNAFGQMTETYAYADELFGYTGRLYDKDTALQYNLNRWYDPKVGRWLSQDPIGFAGGDPNLYAYVDNEVTTATDPSGTDPWSVMPGTPHPFTRYPPVPRPDPMFEVIGTWLDPKTPLPSNPICAGLNEAGRAPVRLGVTVVKGAGYLGGAVIDVGGMSTEAVSRWIFSTNWRYSPLSPYGVDEGGFFLDKVSNRWIDYGKSVSTYNYWMSLGKSWNEPSAQNWERVHNDSASLLPFLMVKGSMPVRGRLSAPLRPIEEPCSGGRPVAPGASVPSISVADTGTYPSVPAAGIVDTLPTRVPKPSPNFQPPTNLPQVPPSRFPAGWRLRSMPPTQQYPDGYWTLEKPMSNSGWQGIDPSTMRPGPQPQTHVPWPDPNQ